MISESNSQTKARDSWLKFLNPESLRENLILASLYLSAYEVLRTSIVDPIKSFFAIGWSPEGDTIDPRYAQEVLGLNRSPLYASALWLQQHRIIEAADLKKLDAIREHRNAIAHNLPTFIASADAQVDTTLFQGICELVGKRLIDGGSLRSRFPLTPTLTTKTPISKACNP